MTVSQVEPSEEREGTVELMSALEPSSRLQQFATDGRAAYQIALSVSNTPFVPTSYKTYGRGRDKKWLEPEQVAKNVTAAWLAGDEIGLRPMQALQAIDIIEGRPALNALAMRALVQSAGHEVWVAEKVQGARGQRMDISVTVKGRRRGSEHVEEAVWSLDRARQAGLLEKDNWQNHPLAMCIARATSEVCRQIGADVLLGLAYSVEELADGEDQSLGGSAGDNVVRVARPKPESHEPEPEPEPEPPALQTNDEIDAAGPEQLDEDGQEFIEDPPEASIAEEQAVCQQVKPEDPTKGCSRDAGHDGRHFYGRVRTSGRTEEEQRTQQAQAEPEPVADPETTEPELDPTLTDPEEDDPFPQPSDEEQERAYLLEQEERAARAAGVSVASTRPVEAPPASEVKPVAAPDSAPVTVDADAPADDPWADFQ